MKNFVFYILILLATGIFFIRCEPEYVSTSANIHFNTDTLQLDTIVAQAGSPTYSSLKVKNKSKNNTEQISVQLSGGNDSYFTVNINGNPLSSRESVSLKKNDSLFIFVEIKAISEPPLANGMHEIIDSLILESGNHREKVILTSQLINAETKAGEIKETSWGPDKYIFIKEDVTIPKDQTLNISQGCRIYFNNQTSLMVEGSLKAEGTCDNRIVFRGYRHDHLTNLRAYEQVPRQWGKIWFKPQSTGNVLTFCEIRNAKTGIQAGQPGENGTEIEINNSKLVYNGDVNILNYNSGIEMNNCILSNTDQQMHLYGGKINLLHCTLANYSEWRENYSQQAVEFYSEDSLGNTYEFELSKIRNSIIYGNSSNEINVPEDKTITEYAEFTSSLIKLDEPHPEIINETPQFKSTEPFKYDFHLTENSPAVSTGSLLDNPNQEKDFECNPRDEKPDIGAIEFSREE